MASNATPTTAWPAAQDFVAALAARPFTARPIGLPLMPHAMPRLHESTSPSPLATSYSVSRPVTPSPTINNNHSRPFTPAKLVVAQRIGAPSPATVIAKPIDQPGLLRPWPIASPSVVTSSSPTPVASPSLTNPWSSALQEGSGRHRCGGCAGCSTKLDCETCINCLDKPRFGGTNVRRKACVQKTCTAPKPRPPKRKPSFENAPMKVVKAVTAVPTEPPQEQATPTFTARSSTTCDGDEHEDKKKAEDEEANNVVKKMLAENKELLDRFEAVHGLFLIGEQ